jgi:hypothetical protein
MTIEWLIAIGTPHAQFRVALRTLRRYALPANHLGELS